jgi:fumarylacetoacetase
MAITCQKSWIKYDSECLYPIQNLPYGVFYVKGETTDKARVGVAIGDSVLDLKVIESMGFFKDLFKYYVFDEPHLNKFMALGRPSWIQVRKILQDLLDADNPKLRDDENLKKLSLFKLADVINLVPAKIGDYTDFYSSKDHASNVGRLFRPDEEPLKPNWVWLPVGYHGRASSVVISGTPLRRPNGQLKPPNAATPHHGHCAKLDFELEIAYFLGPGNNLGEPIKMDKAEDHIFGIVVMNDWSARDIQAWEYVPLGPFGAKNFGTTISPWVVTLEALEPFKTEAPKQDPEPLAYLKATKPGAYDINLEVLLSTEKHPEPMRISQSNFKYMYWTMFQQLVHHTVSGCNMSPGDLLGSGTISGPGELYGSFLEISLNGKKPLVLPSGENRSFIEDGDNLIMRGWCQGNGYRIGFGEAAGVILPALDIN